MRRYGGFVSMQGMRNHLSVLDHCVRTSNLSIHRDRSLSQSIPLLQSAHPHIHIHKISNLKTKETYIILRPPIPKLRRKNLLQRPTPPSLLAERIIRKMIRPHPPQSSLIIIRHRPEIARRRHGHFWRFSYRVRGRYLESRVDGIESHDGRRQFTSPDEMGEDAG